MGIVLTIKTVFRNLWSAKFRSFLTMLGLIIGISSVIMIISIGEGAQSLIVNEINTLGTDKIGVFPGASDEVGPPAAILGIETTSLVYRDYEALIASDKNPYIKDGIAFALGSGQAEFLSRNYDVSIYGATSNFLEMENTKLIEGAFFNNIQALSTDKVAVIGYELARDLFGDPTDVVGKRIKIENKTFRVIGLLEQKGGGNIRNYDDAVIIPLGTAQKSIFGIDYLHLIRLQVNDVDTVDQAVRLTEEILRDQHGINRFGGEGDDFTVRSAKDALGLFETITDTMTYFLAGIAAVSLLVGGIGVMNIMLIAVQEKIREIGIRKSFGATRTDILKQFLLETLVISLFAGLVGILFGLSVSFIVAFIAQYMGFNWDFIISPLSVILGLGLSVCIALVFGIYPAFKAARLNPIEALRYE